MPHFRGIFMRNTLPTTGPRVNETGILNLDTGEGTHWTAYVKKGENCLYFDSYGDLRPPKEFIQYMNRGGDGGAHFNPNGLIDGSINSNLRPVRIAYNYTRLQKFNAKNCGHLCLSFLYDTVKTMF